MTDILTLAQSFEDEIIRDRRFLHQNAELGFELPKTVGYIKKVLSEIGCKPVDCGSCGVYTVIGKNTKEPCVLLRADTDALPVSEASGEKFSAPENMHACGHDMHTAMLLGAARILKNCEDELKAPVKLLFQPAEETLSGAKNMIEAGILKAPPVKSAFMLHVLTDTVAESGTVIVSTSETGAPSADYFEVEVTGKGCHGAMPNTGVDPIITAAHIITSLDTVKTRELSVADSAVLTVGSLLAGSAHNIIPDSAKLCGTVRAYDDKVRNLMKDSIVRIAENTAKAFRAEAAVTFVSGCPCLLNNKELSKKAHRILSDIFPAGKVCTSDDLAKSSDTDQRPTGSEDFSYFSQEVPSLMLSISAGARSEGYNSPLHHPKVRFNEACLVGGAAAYAAIALNI